MPVFACRACGHGGRRERWVVAERMFGWGDRFDYGECASCGAMSIAEVPADLDRYYPPDYGAFGGVVLERGWWRRAWLIGDDPRALARQVIGLLPNREARVLDVGMGRGGLLRRLHAAGLNHLCGIDPHLPPEAEQPAPIEFRRGTIEDCEGGWDLIMYHHVFEHVADPRRELRAAAARLKPGGRLLIRVPLADSWARRHFGPDWVQWDAPRHLWLPTRAAMRRLALEAGLQSEQFWDDSSSFQSWGSRRYRRGLKMHGMMGGGTRAQLIAAAPALIAGQLRARWLNWRRQGDQGAFVLRSLPQG